MNFEEVQLLQRKDGLSSTSAVGGLTKQINQSGYEINRIKEAVCDYPDKQVLLSPHNIDQGQNGHGARNDHPGSPGVIKCKEEAV